MYSAMFGAPHSSQQKSSRTGFIKGLILPFGAVPFRRMLLLLLVPLACSVMNVDASHASTVSQSTPGKTANILKQADFDSQTGNADNYIKSNQKNPVYVVNETPEKSFWDRLIDDPDDFALSILTFFLVVFAGIQGIFLYKQDKKLELSLARTKEANDESKEALKHAKEANQIAQKANLETKLSSQRSLRAYLNIETSTSSQKQCGIRYNVDYTRTTVPEIYGRYDFFLINRGKTPAYKVRYCTHVGMVDRSLDPESTISAIQKDLPLSQTSMFLNPGQDHKISGDFRFNSSGVLFGTGRSLLVTGKVIYEDVYCEEHTLEFSFTLPDTAPPGIPDILLYSVGNNAN